MLKKYAVFKFTVFLCGFLFIAHPAFSQNTRLDKILENKVLRVGTTFDYPPYTFKNKNGEPEGIDIEMAKSLAKSLEAKIEFVQTTWPTLIKDLKDNRFDIAMGGISKKLFRQQIGLFTDGYEIDGKTAISRCEDIQKFSSLNQIDQPKVRVIVNPGGTNERFVKKHISKANVITFQDNKKIFDEILNNNADVMLTDGIEVKYQSFQKPKLCQALSQKSFALSEKAYLLPRDLIWLEYANTWLNQIKIDETLKNTYVKYVGSAP